MSDNDFREVIDGEENKEPTASDNNLHTTDAESAECMNSSRMSEWLECIRIEKAAGKIRRVQRVALKII